MFPSRRLVLVFLIGIAFAVFSLHHSDTIFGILGVLVNFRNPEQKNPHTSTMSSPRPVIVVGSGLAGLSAAYEALQAGARVHMLDRAPKPGGNSIKASSGINGAHTRFQKAAGIAKDDAFYGDSVRSAGRRFSQDLGKVDRTRLVSVLTEGSEGAVNWVADEFGVDLSVVAILGGHTVPRTHRGAGKLPPGAAIVTAMQQKLNANPSFQLSSLAEVVSLAVQKRDGDGSVVTGVRYVQDQQTHDLDGAVVFAAGGFAGDATGLLAKHRPDLAGLPSTNDDRPGSHGILEAVGVEFVDMTSVQVHPTGFVDPKDPAVRYKFLAAEALRGEGGILLSDEDRRFVNELDTREKVSEAIMNMPHSKDSRGDGSRQWDVTLLLDPGACEATAGHLGFYVWKGLMQKKKVRDLSPAAIEAVDRYAESVAQAQDEGFGRTNFGRWRLPAGEANRDEEVCVGRVTPVTHFTMGGAAFNDKAQPLREGAKPVEGLWTAGEITGGIHGDNRLGGSSLLECVVFGRVAGSEAAKYVKQ
ncbi:FAD binding domain-containing protein [Apiospora marii]|uniref:Fumarate reductase n=1 Tax=Apiospora marii TaxID=335849 RepID=A0ABR1R0Z1_9PEZI